MAGALIFPILRNALSIGFDTSPAENVPAWSNGRISDEGRFLVSRDEQDRGAFKTPTLREIARTAPYMHNGSLATLEDVIEFYSEVCRRNPYLDPRMRPLGLSSGEKKALAAFLLTLNGPVSDGL